MNQEEQTFHDSLAAKVYSATKKDREKQTAELSSKLDELKPKDIVFPEIPVTDMAETNAILKELKDELQKPCHITLKLKLI